jgi:6-pyruvoyltetrahydropterin/6-carboxytetrahydropterin synthase
MKWRGGTYIDPMPRCAVTRRVHFNAAHRLHNPSRPPEWNRDTFGPCNNPNFHGHNYEMDVTVEGEIDPETGYVLDIAKLKELVENHVVSKLDHRNLNLDVPWFRELMPSSDPRGTGAADPALGNSEELCRVSRFISPLRPANRSRRWCGRFFAPWARTPSGKG